MRLPRCVRSIDRNRRSTGEHRARQQHPRSWRIDNTRKEIDWKWQLCEQHVSLSTIVAASCRCLTLSRGDVRWVKWVRDYPPPSPLFRGLISEIIKYYIITHFRRHVAFIATMWINIIFRLHSVMIDKQKRIRPPLAENIALDDLFFPIDFLISRQGWKIRKNGCWVQHWISRGRKLSR